MRAIEESLTYGFMSFRTVAAVATVLLLLSAAPGCSGKSTNQSPAERALVTKAEITRAADSPLGTVLRLWRSVQVGDVPSAAGFYDPRVRRALGFNNVVGALARQRSTLALLRPRVVSVSRTPLGSEVIVAATSGGSGVGTQSFLLRHGQEGWRVAYDTLLGDALPGYVQSEAQRRIAPESDLSPAAIRAGERANGVYRTLFADALRPVREARP
jgi:hypothetical protein